MVTIQLRAASGATKLVFVPDPVVTSPPTAKPLPPTGLKVTSVTSTSVTLDWNDSTDLRAGDKYQVYTDDVWVGNQESTTSGATVNGLTPGSAHLFRVGAGKVGSYGDWTVAVPGTTTGTTPPPPTGAAVNRPANPMLIAYGDTNVPTAAVKAAWSKPGALIISGRNNFGAQWLKDVAAGGATVIMYFHPGLINTFGRYADLFYNSSAYGPAIANWPANSFGPGPWRIDQYGLLPNFKVGNAAYWAKLPLILNLMLDENPHVSGIFFDGLGSRHWPGDGGFSWDTWPSTDQEEYRAGNIKVCQVARGIADKRNLFLMVNGQWQSGGIQNGGGYPDRNKHGNSLVDGVMFENRPPDGPGQFAYEYSMNASNQWGIAIPRIANMPNPKGYIISNNAAVADRDRWVSLNAVSHAASGTDYSTLYMPWKTTFTDFKMPNRKV